jgi:zinc/manganese transport system ATP-binding protein
LSAPVLQIRNATLGFQEKTLWSNLNLDVQPREFIAVIGANGSGKTSLLKAILGEIKLTSGEIRIDQKLVRRGNHHVGYIPQHRSSDASVPLLAKDMVRLGIDGDRFGLPLPSRKTNALVTSVLAEVDASHLAKKKVGSLSGGELQRLRVGQAVVSSPDLILADEPLSALDLHQQKVVADLLNRQRQEHEAAVLFVTHDVNPILEYVDRVLYLANGKFRIGTPDEVLRSEVLTELYGTPVDVVRNQGRIVVVGTNDEHHHHADEQWR